MARVLSICKHCGDVEVTLDEISVRVWPGTDAGEYTLRCPHCEAATVWLANPETIDLLVAAGAEPASVARSAIRSAPSSSGHRPRAGISPAYTNRRRRRFAWRHPRGRR